MTFTFTVTVHADGNVPSPEQCDDICDALDDAVAGELIMIDNCDFSVQSDWKPS